MSITRRVRVRVRVLKDGCVKKLTYVKKYFVTYVSIFVIIETMYNHTT